jgi:tetratricopeptide (TPR) repeat protein
VLSLYRSVGAASGVILWAVLCLAGIASAQDASRDVQQAALAPLSSAESCLQAVGGTPAWRVRACSEAIASGELGGRPLAMAYVARAGAYAASSDTVLSAADYRQAVRAFSAIMDTEVLDPNLLFLRGTAYHALGDADAALADYDLAIRLSPTSPIAFIDRGILLTAYKQQYMLAIMDFDSALALAPDNTAALVHRAEAYAGSGDAKRALADYDRVLVLAPGNAEALAGRAALQASP